MLSNILLSEVDLICPLEVTLDVELTVLIASTSTYETLEDIHVIHLHITLSTILDKETSPWLCLFGDCEVSCSALKTPGT